MTSLKMEKAYGTTWAEPAARLGYEAGPAVRPGYEASPAAWPG